MPTGGRRPDPGRGPDPDDVFADPTAPRPPPDLGLSWPGNELLDGAPAVLARPDPVFAPEVFRLVANPVLWVDVPAALRTPSVAHQRDDLERFVAHWDRHGFGYWLLWSTRVRPGEPGWASATELAGAELVGRDLLGLGGLRWMWWRDAWVLNVFVRLAATAQGRGLARRMLATAAARLDAVVPVPTRVVARTRPTNDAMAALARRLAFTDIGDEQRELGTYRVLVRTVGR